MSLFGGAKKQNRNQEQIQGITKRLSPMVVLFTSITWAPFKAAEICEMSASLNSATVSAGKSNSTKNPSSGAPDSLFPGTFLAVKTPDRVKNSIILDFTKPHEKRTCADANVAWPQSST